VDVFALTPAERALFDALNRRRSLPGHQRIIVSKRATHRLKDLAALPVLEATLAARDDTGS
jgi:hypothetical protein